MESLRSSTRRRCRLFPFSKILLLLPLPLSFLLLQTPTTLVNDGPLDLIAHGRFDVESLPKLHRTDDLRNAYLKRTLKGIYQPLGGGPPKLSSEILSSDLLSMTQPCFSLPGTSTCPFGRVQAIGSIWIGELDGKGVAFRSEKLPVAFDSGMYHCLLSDLPEQHRPKSLIRPRSDFGARPSHHRPAESSSSSNHTNPASEQFA